MDAITATADLGVQFAGREQDAIANHLRLNAPRRETPEQGFVGLMRRRTAGALEGVRVQEQS